MIVFPLTLIPTPTYLPGESIKKFDSFVWVERYQTDGDFQLVINDDKNILKLLPLGALLSHTDTKEVMIVENHEIVRDKKKSLKVTISGRSFETFAEERPVTSCDTALYPSDASTVRNADLTYTMASENVILKLLKDKLEPGTASANDRIPNLLIRTAIRVLDTSMAHVIKRGDTYSRVLEHLRLSDSGIKIVRPNGAQTTMDIVIHDGLDKTLSVVFYARSEDLDDVNYFWSIKGYKNYAQIATHTASRLHPDRSLLGADVIGLARRVLYVEEESILGTFPTQPITDVVGAFAQLNLDGYTKAIIMDAKISQTAKPKFKIDYDIGDLVKVVGEFETAQTMRVTEHILTVDKDGIRGYPSLSIV